MPHSQTRRPWLAVASALNVAVLAAGYALLRILPEQRWPGPLLVVLPQWVWLLCPLACLAWSARTRARPLIALAAASLCFAALTLGAFEFAGGSPAHAANPGHRLCVATWNVHNEFRHAGDIRRQLLRHNPDIICLQEAWDKTFDTFLPGWSQFNVEAIRLYSRTRLLRVAEVRVPGRGFRQWVAAEVETPGRRLTIIDVHLLPSAPGDTLTDHRGSLRDYLTTAEQARAFEWQVIRQALPPTEPVVVCGDFNTPARSAVQAPLAECMTDAFQATRFGLGLTFLMGKRLPCWRIDHVWCGNGVVPIRCIVGDDYPSDHRPLIAEVLVP